MATTTWTGESGNWTDPTWTDGVPDASLDAIADGTGLSPITISFDTPSGAAHSLTMADATLAITGGALSLDNASSLDALTQSGGLLDLAGGGTFAGPVAETAGTIAVDSGSLLVSGGGSFAGALTGAGEITFAAGAVTLESGLVLSVATLVVDDTTALAGDITDTGLFTLTSTGTLDLAGHDFIADHNALHTEAGASLSGLIEGPGTFTLKGSGFKTVNGLTTAGSLTIADVSVMNVDGLLTLGTSTTDQTTLAIAAVASFDLQQGAAIATSGSVFIRNSGVFEDTAQSGTISVRADVNNSGLVEILNYTAKSGVDNELLFSAGTFTDAGSVVAEGGLLAFGPGASVTNLANGTLTGGTWEAINGTIALTGGPITTLAATIVLNPAGAPDSFQAGVIAAGNGNSFTLLQHSLSTIAQDGVLDIYSGGGYVTKRNLVDNGGLVLWGRDQLGTLSIGATGTLTEVGTLTAASIRNGGTVIIPANNDSDSLVKAPFASRGTMVVDGTLELVGASNFLDGLIGGVGTLVLDSGTSTTIGAGVRAPAPGGDGALPDVALNGASLTFDASLPYSGFFGAGAGSTVDLGGHTIKLARSNLIGDPVVGALVNGGGTLVDLHSMALGYVTFSGGIELANNGTITENGGPVTLGDASGGTASLVNRAGAIYAMAGAVALNAASATADTISNAGTFKKTGTGTAIIGAAFTNTGTIDVISGTLEITAAFTNTGSIIGTETQADGITYITAPSAALFNQYATATHDAGSAALSSPLPPPPIPTMPTLAAPHA